jgi:hypothetical protein
LLENRTLLSTVHWINRQGGYWDVAKNWSTGHVPLFSDDVVIDIPVFSAVTIRGPIPAIHSVQSSDPITISGGALTVAAASSITNLLTLNGGNLAGAGALAMQQLEWDNGAMIGPGETDIVAGGTLEIDRNFQSTSSLFLNGRTLNNAGSA